MLQAFAYWRDLTPGRPPRILIEFETTAELFDQRVGKGPSTLTRADVAGFRDSLLAEGLAAATVRKRLGFVGAMIQTQFDAGRMAINVARGLRVPRPRVPVVTRTEFSPEQLAVIFNSPVYRDGRRPHGGGGQAAPWLPVVKRHPVLTPGATFGIDPLVQVNFSNSLSVGRCGTSPERRFSRSR